MRVVLINPRSPFLEDEAVFPPLGLWYLEAQLEREGHEVQTVDMGLDNVIPEADAYGITGTTPQAPYMKMLVETLAPRGKPITVGGPHATLFQNEVMSWGPTNVVIGEGELLVSEALKGAPGRVFVTTRMRTDQLDALAFPHRHDAKRYHFLIDGAPATTMFTGRGCPYRCAFCCHAIWGQQVALRSAENVVAEARELVANGWTRLMFFDDTFSIKVSRVIEICNGLAPLHIRWRAFVRVDTITPAMLHKMAEAGCVEVGIGIESGSQTILDAAAKGTTVWQNTRALQLCHEAGIAVKAFIIIGLPGENRETLKKTKAWLVKNKPAKADITIYTPFARTPITDFPWRYDIRFEPMDEADAWYKGHQAEAVAHVRTAALTAQEITQARHEIEAAYKEALKEDKA